MFFRNEIRKVLRFPLFWVMIACCAGLNIFVIADGMSYERIGIQAVNEYVRSGNVPSYDEYNVCVNYDEVKESAYDQYYKDFDIMAFKADIEKMFVTPHSAAAQKIIDRNYQKAAARVDEIRQDGEAYDRYYPGVTFSLHEMLYDNLFLLMLFELALIACFMTAYLMKYEEFYDTHQNVYATKVGRAIVFSKAGNRTAGHGAVSLYHMGTHEPASLLAARLCGGSGLHGNGFTGHVCAVLRLQKRLHRRRADSHAVLCPLCGSRCIVRKQPFWLRMAIHSHGGYAECSELVHGVCVYPLCLLSGICGRGMCRLAVVGCGGDSAVVEVFQENRY